MFASFVAGPAFVASMLLANWMTAASTTYEFGLDLDGIGAVLAGSIFMAAFGFALSVIPNLLGAWFMHGLGIGNFAARLPVAWALVGAGAAGLPFALIPGLTSEFVPFGTIFAITGTSCALVANRFATWT